jgi:4-alpha-glucanotransferase
VRKRPFLRRLADDAGILPGYVDQRGVTVRTTDEARAALLAAMDVDASSEAAARRALEGRRKRRSAAVIAPVGVHRGGAPRRLAVDLGPPAPAAARSPSGEFEWDLDVEEEGGGRHHASGRGRAAPPATVPLPAGLPAGYHTVRLRVRTAGGEERSGEQKLIVAPPRCPQPRQRGIRRQAFGLLANLYTIRSERNWGIGDLGDLAALARWGAALGADFIGLNPLHALANRDHAISPYAPVSRLFRNVIYIDVEAVPELAGAPALQRRIASAPMRRRLCRLREGDHVDYAAVLDAKLPFLRELHRLFAEPERRPTKRGAEYRRYLDDGGAALSDFATFLALEEELSGGRPSRRGWCAWPARYRDPRSPAVEEFRRRNARAVDFHCFLQFEVDRQLAAAAAAARRGAMRIGLYQDLALGSSLAGADPWMFPGLFLDRLNVGAPPDLFQPKGQDWGLPPIDSERLAEQGHAYWVLLVRNALRHAGALRIDHVMGLFRQYWIPAGASAELGAYVRFPAGDLLGILALESTRAGALVIGEDLGTVPPGLPRVLSDWGILSTRVLYFERTPSGAFKAARRYPANALTSVNTHDLVPLAGYWTGRDLELRRKVRTIPTDADLAAQRREREREKALLVRRLEQEGLPNPQSAIPNPQSAIRTLRSAAHAFLRRTPSALVGLSLDDLAGEFEPVNLPGVGHKLYPSWSRRMKKPLERIRRDREVRESVGAVRRRGSRARRKVRGRQAPRKKRRRRQRRSRSPAPERA